MRSNEEIKSMVEYLRLLNEDLEEAFNEDNLRNILDLQEKEDILLNRKEQGNHIKSVIVSFLWLKGKATDEDLLMNRIPIKYEKHNSNSSQ